MEEIFIKESYNSLCRSVTIAGHFSMNCNWVRRRIICRKRVWNEQEAVNYPLHVKFHIWKLLENRDATEFSKKTVLKALTVYRNASAAV